MACPGSSEDIFGDDIQPEEGDHSVEDEHLYYACA